MKNIVLILVGFAVVCFFVVDLLKRRECFQSNELTVDEVVTSNFNVIMLRNPSANEMTDLRVHVTGDKNNTSLIEAINKLKDGVNAIDSINLEDRLETYRQITGIYEAVLKRLPSMEEMNYYLKQIVGDKSFGIDQVEVILKFSKEYQDVEAEDVEPGTQPHKMYHELFGSDPSKALGEFLQEKYVELNSDDEKFKRYLKALRVVDEEESSTEIGNTEIVDNRYSPMDPNYYHVPITTNLMDVFFETSKCVQNVSRKVNPWSDPSTPMLTGIAIDADYKQPLAKYSNDRNMNELMGNIARNTYYLNNKLDPKEQIVSQPIVYPSNMSANLVSDMESYASDGMHSSQFGTPY